MKSQLRTIDDHGTVYQALVFICPGCAAGGPEGYEGLHMLPVNAPNIGKASWDWNGDLERPTLSPSILTNKDNTEASSHPRCHSFLKNGVFEFLSDFTHPLANMQVEMPDLPEWAEKMS